MTHSYELKQVKGTGKIYKGQICHKQRQIKKCVRFVSNWRDNLSIFKYLYNSDRVYICGAMNYYYYVLDIVALGSICIPITQSIDYNSDLGMFTWEKRRMRHQDPASSCQQRTRQAFCHCTDWTGGSWNNLSQPFLGISLLKYLFAQVCLTSLSRTNPTKLNDRPLETEVIGLQ